MITSLLFQPGTNLSQPNNHGLTYPKRAQMNAQTERFNRTVQEDFVDYHAATLFADMEQFNDRLGPTWSGITSTDRILALHSEPLFRC